MTAALPMGGQKITGMADPIVSTDGATKNYVDASVSAFFSTGDLKPTLKTVADAGWVMGGANATIGNAGSGATYANANALALYTLIWNNISSPTANAFCPVTGGLGASAAADWAGLKPLATGWYSGRALSFAGGGGSLTTRTLGQYIGVESESLTLAQLPTGITSSGSFTSTTSAWTQSGQDVTTFSSTSGASVFQAWASSASVTRTAVTGSMAVTSNNTGGAVHSLMQPTVFVNVMIKL